MWSKLLATRTVVKFIKSSCKRNKLLPSSVSANNACLEINRSVRLISTCCTTLKLHHYQPKVVSSPQHAELFVASLRSFDRTVLAEALQKYQAIKEGGKTDEPPTLSQLKLAAYQTAIPFIGFGFLDNAIMIIAGEYIEFRIGIYLGISTMAAAALGNIVSDVSGLGLAGYVETLAHKLGFEGPKMTSAQLQMTRTIMATNMGRGLGMVLGCIVGMFPLLFYKDKTEEQLILTEETNNETETKDAT